MNLKKAYGSHLPVLMKVVAITDGPILELGGGPFSTPFLHWACFQNKRELHTYDNDPKYFDLIKQYECDFHKVNLVENWDDIVIERPWDLAFVDHAPATRRKQDIARLANFAKYIIIHDSEIRTRRVYQYEEIYPLFKYNYKYRAVKPHTSILSNFVDTRKLEI